MSINEQPMNVYWSGKRTETSNNFKTNYKGSIATKNNLPSLGNKTGDMYNVIESGENFIWNGNSWDSLSGDTLKTLNWQKSEKADVVAIYPVPETTLEPTVDFMFTETLPIEGEKGPDNPSTIVGVKSVSCNVCESEGVYDTPYSIDLGGTYYGGTVNFATGVLEVTKKYIVLNVVSASDGINADGYVASRAWPGVWGGSNVVNDGLAVCEELPYSTAPDAGERFYIGSAASNGERPLWCLLSPSRLDFSGAVDPSNPTSAESRTAVYAYLAEHPLHIVATLETPQTVTLTPNQILSLAQSDKYTPRLNMVYTDASSVQVGYAKSPIRSEYELTQAIAAIEGSE